MKRFQKLLNEVKGEKAHKEAVAMGLKYKGFGYWVDPGTGETKYKTENDELVPVEGEVESEMWKDPRGIGDQPMQGGQAGPMGMMQPGMGQPGMPQAVPGEGLGPAPEPGEETPHPETGWEPGPDGDTCVDTDEPPGEVPIDSYVGRPNNLNWSAGPQGSNFTNVTFAQLKDVMEAVVQPAKKDEKKRSTGIGTNIRRLQGKEDIPMDTEHFPKVQARNEYANMGQESKIRELGSIAGHADPVHYPSGELGQAMARHYVSQKIDGIGALGDRRKQTEAHNKILQDSGMFADPKYDLDQFEDGGDVIGGDQGSFGQVTLGRDGESVIKDGMISKGEMDALHKLKGQTGFPILLNGELRTPFNENTGNAEGRFAMAKARGVPFADAWENDEIMDKEHAVQKVWELRKKLHMNGISHNDLHGGNFFWDDENAQASMVDMGMANDNPLSAFMEALGGVSHEDYQFAGDYLNDSDGNFPYGAPWMAGEPIGESIGERLGQNRDSILEELMGEFPDDEAGVQGMLQGGIRMTDKNLEAITKKYPKLKDPEAVMGLIERLYEGIDGEDELKGRMGSAFDDRLQDLKRASHTGRGLKGMPIIAPTALD